MAGKSGAEIKVGIFVLIALVALGYMSLQVGGGMFASKDTYPLVVYFDNVTGLKTGAPVEIAGIEVGTVSAIDLEDGKARLTLSIRQGVPVRADTAATIKSRGVLGDKFLELRGGSEGMPTLNAGQRIVQSDRSADLEVLFEKVGQIADDIGLVAKSVANVFGGPDGERDLRLTMHSLRDMTVSLNELVQENMQAINEVVTNFRDFSGDMKDITGNNKQSIGVIVDNFESASGKLSATLDNMNRMLGSINEGQGPMAKLVNDEDMGDDLRKAVASLESVAAKIDEGKGTLGKLVNDKKTGKELDKALEGINKYLEKQDTFKTAVDFHAESMSSGDIKSYLNLKLQPSEDKYYLLGVVDDPKGRTKTTETLTRTQAGGGSWVETREEETKTEKDGLKFNAQIAKRWGDWALRGGLFESTGGAAVDYYLWDDRVELYFEAFDFDDDDPPHLKTGAKLYFLKNFYLTAGLDDALAEDGDDRAVFGGVGLYFTDEDLKYLFTSAPSLPQ